MRRRDPKATTTASPTLRNKVAIALRKAIVDGVYAPGDPLGEIELARRFRVSRGPVREAMIQLQNEFLVRSYPNRGSFVYQLNQREFDEILELRSLLEPLAMEHARANASAGRLATLKKLLRELEAQARSSNSNEIAEKDFEFHVALWDLSGRPLLRDLLVQICRPMFVFFRINWNKYRRAGLDFETVAHSHQPLIDYLDGATKLSAQACFRFSLRGGAIELEGELEQPTSTPRFISAT
jgi:DNA-binding GntR family transcriptional regulator